MTVVGIDASPARSGDTGVARYTEELIAALAAHDDLTVRTFAAGRGAGRANLKPDRRLGVPLRVLHPLWRTTGRPRAETLIGPVDVVHAIDLVPPPTRSPVVLTCHDVLPITHPHLYERRYRRLSRRHVRALARADAVVTTCESTATEIVDVAGIDRGRIVVASPGRRTVADAAAASTFHAGGRPSILYVGAITPRKGLHRLVAALARMTDPPPLLVAGPDGMAADTVHAAIDETLRARPSIEIDWRGRVDDDELARLLAGATVLCHPSEAEGFGIPVLEAMGAGTPVLAADIAPVREIGGDAVALAPVHDLDAWAGALEALLADPDRRAAMAGAGRARSEPITWAAMAATIGDVYHRLADR